MKRVAPRSKPAVAVLALALAGGAQAAAGGWSYQEIADALHAIMESDRTVYTRLIVNRLQNEEKVIKASEHWKDDKALVLPAQTGGAGAQAHGFPGDGGE